MSKRTDKIAAKARLAAENAEKLADQLAAAEAADREAALSSPADKAVERAFVRGTLPDVELPRDKPPGSVDEPVPVVPVVERSPERSPLAAVSLRDALIFEGTPIPAPVAVAPDMAETPAALVPLSEVAPLTVEAAVAFQRIPNDRIHHVHERADGTKVDALGHIFEPAPKPK